MKKMVLQLWPFLALVGTTLIFFYPVWLLGLVPIPGDFIVGVYYPWLDYKWEGYPAGVPVKNPITTDVVSFIYPMQMYAISLLKQGMMPLWNNLILGGTPLLANFQSAPFSPTNIIYFVLPQLTSWSLQIAMQPFLAALFLYLLLRFLGRSKLASLAGGLFYAFGGFITIWMQWNGHGLVAAFFPLIMLLVLKWLKNMKILNGILLSVVLALQIFSGYPQIILYEFLSLVLLVLVFDKKTFFNFKKLFGLGIFLILGIGLAGIQILPGLELLSYSQREIEDVINVSAFLPWQMLITFFAPDFYGNHVTRNFWGPGDYTLVTGYSGVVVSILAGLGFLSFFKDKAVRFATSIILLALIIALPNPITLALKESGLLGLQAASAHRILVLSNLGFAILAAFGLDTVKYGFLDKVKIIRSLHIPSIFLLGFGISAAIIIVWLKSANASLNAIEINQVVSDFIVGIKNLVLPMLLLVTTLLMLLATLKWKKFKGVIVVFLFLLGVVELFRFGWKYTPFSPKALIFPSTPVIDFLQKQQQPFRTVAEDVIPINFMMAYGIETLEGYDAVYPIRTAQYLSALNSDLPDNTPMGRYGSVTNFNSNLLDFANVKYILALKRNRDGKVDKNGSVPSKFDPLRYKKVFEDGTVVVLENLKMKPRAFMVYSWKTEKNLKNLLSELINSSDIELILENIPKMDKSDGIYQLTYSQLPNKKEVFLKTEQDRMLVVDDSYFPGWKVYVDGKEGSIYQANYSFMAVPVAKGDHQIIFEYSPDSFKNGKMISLISLIGLFTTYFIWSSKKSKKSICIY